MKTFGAMFGVVVFACFVFLAYSQGNPPLKMVQTIPLPGVEGRIDHLSVDLKGQRLFIAALENNTLEVVDLAQGKRIRSVSGLKEPQGIVFVPESNQVFVASGGDGTLKAFDASSLALAFSLNVGGDADNIRYDPAGKQILVGYGSGALGSVDIA